MTNNGENWDYWDYRDNQGQPEQLGYPAQLGQTGQPKQLRQPGTTRRTRNKVFKPSSLLIRHPNLFCFL